MLGDDPVDSFHDMSYVFEVDVFPDADVGRGRDWNVCLGGVRDNMRVDV